MGYSFDNKIQNHRVFEEMVLDFKNLYKSLTINHFNMVAIFLCIQYYQR